LKRELAADLEDIHRSKRLEEDPDTLLRSMYKEFGRYYAKGKYHQFWPWVEEAYPRAVLLPPPRGDKGPRQDWSVDFLIKDFCTFDQDKDCPEFQEYMKDALTKVYTRNDGTDVKGTDGVGTYHNKVLR
jgi:hypothetical protein